MIGIPAALWYFLHPGLWEDFFHALGLRVVLSSGTVRQTVARAGLISESEHCLPIKLHDAHLAELVDQVGLVFVPRILSTLPRHIACPKLGALPDCAQAQFGERAEFVTVDVDQAKKPLRRSMLELGRRLAFPRSVVKVAADQALTKLAARRRHGTRSKTMTAAGRRRRKILLLGHPYNLADPYMSGPVTGKLQALGAEFATVDHGRTEIADGPIKWDACSIMYDALRNLQRADWAGVIQISSFNCGCDSIAMQIFQSVLKNKRIPYMRLVLDEYDGRAGLDTRLEAFVDSTGWRDHAAATCF